LCVKNLRFFDFIGGDLGSAVDTGTDRDCRARCPLHLGSWSHDRESFVWSFESWRTLLRFRTRTAWSFGTLERCRSWDVERNHVGLEVATDSWILSLYKESSIHFRKCISHTHLFIFFKSTTVTIFFLSLFPLSLSSFTLFYFNIILGSYSFKEWLVNSDPRKLPGSSCCIPEDLRNIPRISPYRQWLLTSWEINFVLLKA